MQASTSPEAVAAALERALARPELREQGELFARFLGRFIDWLGELFDFGISPSESLAAARVVWWIVLALLGFMLVRLLLRLAREGLELRRSGPGPAGAALVVARVAELRARARAAEAAGDWLAALRLYFFALVVGLGQRGDLEYRDAWTNRELLARGDPAPAVARQLAPLVRELDERSFGSLLAGPEDARRYAAACDRLLGSSP